MQINKLLTPYNLNSGNTSRIKFIVLHYVGATGGAEANCKYSASKYIGASAHYYVGHAGEVWQSVEDKDIAWHCGASSYKHKDCRNANSIGIELCTRKANTTTMGAEDQDWYFEKATIAKAIELTKELMKKYNIPAENVIRHYDVTGKTCPSPFVHNNTEYTWAAFKQAIQGKSEATAAQPSKTEPKPPKTESTAAAKPSADTTEYQIKTTCDVLNIRSGAGTKHPVVGAIKETAKNKNIYTIVEEKDGWGKLKSGKGWISLTYVTRVGGAGAASKATDYQIKTTCHVLNIRSGAGMNYPVVGAIRETEKNKNVYTIVEEKDGWGKLKSGKGWIFLKYIQKV